jgi:nucleotide-binding universal stress UspA family protein
MRVLVALDRTQRAAEAARALANWAKETNAEIHLLHVLHPEQIPETAAASGFTHALTPGGTFSGQTLNVHEPYPKLAEDRTQAIARAIAETEDDLRNIAQRFFPTLTVTTHVEPSRDTAAQIVKEATRIDADFIAMSTRGRHGIGSALFGSIHDEVVRQAKVPVLLIGPEAGA